MLIFQKNIAFILASLFFRHLQDYDDIVSGCDDTFMFTNNKKIGHTARGWNGADYLYPLWSIRLPTVVGVYAFCCLPSLPVITATPITVSASLADISPRPFIQPVS